MPRSINSHPEPAASSRACARPEIGPFAHRITSAVASYTPGASVADHARNHGVSAVALQKYLERAGRYVPLKREHTARTRSRAVAEVLAGERRAVVARRYDIPFSTLASWCQTLDEMARAC